MKIVIVNEEVPEHNLLAFFSKAEKVVHYRRPEEAVDYIRVMNGKRMHFFGAQLPDSLLPAEITLTSTDGVNPRIKYPDLRCQSIMPYDTWTIAKININMIESGSSYMEKVHCRIRGFQFLGGRVETLREMGFSPENY